MAKHKTNVQFVKHIMEYSQHGALMQVFIMQALDQYSKRVAASTPEKLDSPMVDGRSWHGCAKELQAALDAHFERPPVQTLAEMEAENTDGFRNPIKS
jgi:hypothetical protein